MAISLQSFVLIPPEYDFSESFGFKTSLSEDGKILVVGAKKHNYRSAQTGLVYSYQRLGDKWALAGVAQPESLSAPQEFGAGVSISGNGLVLAVGAPALQGTQLYEGVVYIYDWEDIMWVHRSTLTHSAPVENLRFGSSVSLNYDGSILAVGNTGLVVSAVYGIGGVNIFDWNGSSWSERSGSPESPITRNFSYFGRTVQLSSDGTVLLVSASRNATDASSREGLVYTYDYADSAWTMRSSHLVGATTFEEFGTGLALNSSATRLYASAPWAVNVKSYDLSGDVWVDTTEDLEGVDDSFGTGLACDGSGTLLAIGVPDATPYSALGDTSAAGVVQFAYENANTLSGLVRDETNSLVARIVRVYDADGYLAGTTVSDEIDGTFSINVPQSGVYSAVCVDDAGGTDFNDLISSRNVVG